MSQTPHDQGTAGALTQDLARRVLDEALAKAAKLGSPSSVAVVDAGRELLAFQRMDDALLASVAVSQAKAFTARSMNMPTADIGPLVQPGAPFYGLEITQRVPMVTFGGGLPIEVGGEVVGAVGVAGGTAEQDAEIAEAGAAAVRQV